MRLDDLLLQEHLTVLILVIHRVLLGIPMQARMIHLIYCSRLDPTGDLPIRILCGIVVVDYLSIVNERVLRIIIPVCVGVDSDLIKSVVIKERILFIHIQLVSQG